MRNSQGFASHGPDGYMEALDPIQAVFAARSADALVHFLFNAHRSYAKPMVRDNGNNKPSLYEMEQEREAVNYVAHPEFNYYIDELYWPTEIFGTEYKTSEVLSKVDVEAYLTNLEDYEANPPEEEE